MKLALHWQIAIGMLVGALIGVSLNLLAGPRETVVATQQLPTGVTGLTISDSPNHIRVAWTRDDGSTGVAVVDGTRQTPGAAATVDELARVNPEAADWLHRLGRSPARVMGEAAQKVGNLFLRLLQMVAVPLIITSLICGVTYEMLLFL